MQRFDLRTTPVEEAVAAAVAALQAGQLVIYPTETTYGIGADATSAAAIQTLLQYKRHRQDKPFSVLVADQTMAGQYAELNSTALHVWERFLPGPVTVVVPGNHLLTPGVESLQGTLALRHSSHPVAQELVETFGRPLTATSANPSNHKRPYQVEDVLDALSNRQLNLIGVILDAGPLPPNEPSTIVDTTLDSYQVLREGAVHFPETQRWTTRSVEETIELGEKLARRQKNRLGQQPLIFALSGPMGAGKTHLTKGIAYGLGVDDLVKSPSYILMNEYTFMAEGETLPLVHIDAWRMEAATELQGLELERILQQSGVIVLEWANTRSEFLTAWIEEFQAHALWITLEYGDGENERVISLGEAA